VAARERAPLESDVRADSLSPHPGDAPRCLTSCASPAAPQPRLALDTQQSQRGCD
jgi:hypothetical protein